MASSSSMSAAVTLASGVVQWKTFLYFRFDSFFQTVNWVGKRKTETEFFRDEGVICIALLCSQLSIWSASLYYEDLNWSEAEASYKNVVMLGKTIALVKVMEMVVEVKVKLYELKGMELGGKWDQLTGAASF